MAGLKRGAIVALVVLAALAAAAGVAWKLDERAHEGRVARGVTLAGTPVGGLYRERLASVVEELAGRYRVAQVTVEAPGGGFTTDARSLGLQVATPDTIRGVMRMNRTGGPVERLRSWALGFLRPQAAPVRISVDALAVRRVVDERDRGPRRPAVEPGIALERGAFVAVPGKPGEGIDPADVIRKLPAAARRGLPIVVPVDRGEVAPRFTVADARRVAGEAQTRVNSALAVTAGATSASVPVDTVRGWMGAKPTDTGLVLSVDHTRALQDLEKMLAEAGEPPVETRFTVEDGRVRVVAGRNGTGCCAPAAAEAVERAVLAGRSGPVTLALRTRTPQLTPEAAARLNIVEEVATFRTSHPPNQPRVRNIHRIADLIRGQVIPPGATFSVNGFVGRRTADKGFVSAPVIEDGVFSEGVGGGVSQFATTLFNAAFLAGLDFDEYQSHSIYISRYPYGREATLNYPRPDLKIRNSTPHGVLIWTSYTERDITVTLYSTRHVQVAQTNQTRAPQGRCTRVTTERTRTYLDGRTEVDRVYATYRPGEGVNC